MMQESSNVDINLSDTKPTYAHDLWDQFGSVTEKLLKGKNSIKQLITYFKHLAEMEDKTAKFLGKVGFDYDNGQLNESLKLICDLAQGHGNVLSQTVVQLKSTLHTELTELKREISSVLKTSIAEEKKYMNEYNNAKNHLIKTKNTELKDKKEYESLHIQYLKGSDLPPKNLQKLQVKVASAEKLSVASDNNYRVAVERCNEARNNYFKKLQELLTVLEELDRRRIKTVKAIIEKYVFLQETQFQSLQHCVSMTRTAVNRVDEEQDVQAFIAKMRTNLAVPQLEVYVPYVVNMPEELKSPGVPRRNSSEATHPQNITITTSPLSNVENATPNSLSGSSPSAISQSSNTSSTTNTTRSGGQQPGSSFASLHNVAGGFQSNNTTTPNSTLQTTTTAKPPTKRKFCKTVRVLYDYSEADVKAGELKLRAGDIIHVTETDATGWWKGECNGIAGVFPSNFVQEISGNSATPGGEMPSMDGRGIVIKALFDYKGNDSSELSFKAGESITVQMKKPDGWWVGQIGARQGFFPSNYTDAEDAPSG